MKWSLFCSFVWLMCSPHAHAVTIDAPDLPADIPDDDPAGLNVVFDFDGVNVEISNVTLTLEMSHEHVGDLTATLTSPMNEATLVIFSRVGADRQSEMGDDSPIDGVYDFNDQGTDLWQTALGTNEPVPAATYRTSTAGQPLLSNYGGATTALNVAFGDQLFGSSGVTSAGTWMLRIKDEMAGNVGSIASASLTLEARDLIFSDGFDGIQTPTRVMANGQSMANRGSLAVQADNRVDFSGNGLADFAVLGVSQNNFLNWRVLENLGSGTAGLIDEFIMPNPNINFVVNSADIDGDGIADAISYDRNNHEFLLRRSTRPSNAFLPISLGSAGDISDVLGDYDADGIIDPAVFTTGAVMGDPMQLQYISSASAELVVVPMGDRPGDEARIIAGEDYDGDGHADVLVFVDNNYTVKSGLTGGDIDQFTFATPTPAVILMGDFTGNLTADVTHVYIENAEVKWRTRNTQTGMPETEVILGSIAVPNTSEFLAAADYDGDGKQDYAVWRRNNTAADSSLFIFRPSSDPNNPDFVIHGSNTEFSVASAQGN